MREQTTTQYGDSGCARMNELAKIESIYPYIREDIPIVREDGLMKATVLKRGQFQEVHRADDADDLFKKLESDARSSYASRSATCSVVHGPEFTL